MKPCTNSPGKTKIQCQMHLLVMLLNAVLFCLLMTPFAMMFGQTIEAYLFPVITDVTVVEVPASQPNSVALKITGNKRRSCDYLEVTGVVKGIGEVKQPAIIVPSPRQPTGVSRPTGLQSFGVWEFSPISDEVYAVVRHNCHPGWSSVSDFVVWRREVPFSRNQDTNGDGVIDEWDTPSNIMPPRKPAAK